ncbi:MAG: cell division protein FtsA, partial [Myxococcales bacterium]|nr:cell division protein FtsA [Myxococcales bacterium]
HIVTGAMASLQNIIKCANRCGVQVADIVLEQLASGAAVLTPEEKELGVAVVDIGGGTTDIAVWMRRAIIHTAVIPLGGNNITKDIAVGLRTPMGDAEEIKTRYGCAMTDMVSGDETIEVPSVGGRRPRSLKREILSTIIEPRAEEMLALVGKHIEEACALEDLASGIVLTGGSACMEGMPDLAEEVLGVPVRRGVPRGVGGLVDVVRNPRFATGVGLVLQGSHAADQPFVPSLKEEGITSRFFKRMRSWIRQAV